jgi:hypothetical protein
VLPINLEELQRFAGTKAEITIHDEQGGDQAATVKKAIKKIQLCPDQTHVRFYFDQVYFLAVPIKSSITESDSQWSAFDQESGLTYVIKKDQVD